MPTSTQDVTRSLEAVRAGVHGGPVPLAYYALRRAAGRCARLERPDRTPQPTPLADEAYLRLADSSGKEWRNRAHFLAAAAQTPRNILGGYARARQEHEAAKLWLRCGMSGGDPT